MTKTFKLTIIILILTALAAGGVVGVSQNNAKRKAQSEKEMINNNENEAEKAITDETMDEIEEITPDTNIDTSNWKTYRNTKYGFSFRYPENSDIGANAFNTPPDRAHSVVVFPPVSKPVFNVEVQDPKVWDPNTETSKIIRLDLNGFVKKKWQFNKDDQNPGVKNKKTVGDIEEITLNNRKAYQFTLTGGYQDDRGGYILDTKHLYVFVDNNHGLKYIIWFPSNSEIGRIILKSLKFLN